MLMFPVPLPWMVYFDHVDPKILSFITNHSTQIAMRFSQIQSRDGNFGLLGSIIGHSFDLIAIRT